jgi:hypothetical protein
MNVFRRLITTPASVLYKLTDRVAELAAQIGVPVDERSAFVFAPTELQDVHEQGSAKQRRKG